MFGLKKFLVRVCVILFAVSLFTSLTAGASAAQKINEDSVANRVYSDYFKKWKIDIWKAQEMFGNDAVLACFVAARGGSTLENVKKYYDETGGFWPVIMAKLKIRAPSLFIAVPEKYKVPPPYSKPYSEWKKYRADPKYPISLSKADLDNIIHLHIINSYFKTKVTDIMYRRSRGTTFKRIMFNEYWKATR